MTGLRHPDTSKPESFYRHSFRAVSQRSQTLRTGGWWPLPRRALQACLPRSVAVVIITSSIRLRQPPATTSQWRRCQPSLQKRRCHMMVQQRLCNWQQQEPPTSARLTACSNLAQAHPQGLSLQLCSNLRSRRSLMQTGARERLPPQRCSSQGRSAPVQPTACHQVAFGSVWQSPLTAHRCPRGFCLRVARGCTRRS